MFFGQGALMRRLWPSRWIKNKLRRLRNFSYRLWFFSCYLIKRKLVFHNSPFGIPVMNAEVRGSQKAIKSLFSGVSRTLHCRKVMAYEFFIISNERKSKLRVPLSLDPDSVSNFRYSDGNLRPGHVPACSFSRLCKTILKIEVHCEFTSSACRWEVLRMALYGEPQNSRPLLP